MRVISIIKSAWDLPEQIFLRDTGEGRWLEHVDYPDYAFEIVDDVAGTDILGAKPKIPLSSKYTEICRLINGSMKFGTSTLIRVKDDYSMNDLCL